MKWRVMWVWCGDSEIEPQKFWPWTESYPSNYLPAVSIKALFSTIIFQLPWVSERSTPSPVIRQRVLPIQSTAMWKWALCSNVLELPYRTDPRTAWPASAVLEDTSVMLTALAILMAIAKANLSRRYGCFCSPNTAMNHPLVIGFGTGGVVNMSLSSNILCYDRLSSQRRIPLAKGLFGSCYENFLGLGSETWGLSRIR